MDSSSPHIPPMETLPHLQTWPCRGRDRCSKWYLGHGRPSLAPCEGETDVNELLSWWLVEQHSPKLPHLSPSSSSELGIQTVAGGSGLLRDFLEAGESFVMMTQMPPLFCPPPPTPPSLRLGSEIPSRPGNSAHHSLNPHQEYFLTKSFVVCSGPVTKLSLSVRLCTPPPPPTPQPPTTIA